MERYHGIKVSQSGVRNVLVRHHLNRLPKNQRKRTIKSRYKRYEKQVPGHRMCITIGTNKNSRMKPNNDYEFTRTLFPESGEQSLSFLDNMLRLINL